MCVCVYVCIYICIYVHIYIYIICIYTCRVSLLPRLAAHSCRLDTCCAFLHTHHMLIHVCVCVRERERETESEREGERDTHIPSQGMRQSS
jgi:hypothetical protein